MNASPRSDSKPQAKAEEVVSPPATRERQRAETRDRVYRAALAEIANVGLAQARIEHIARKAGVTRPTIYAHFPRKEDFLRELQSRTESLALEALRHRLAQGDRDGADLVHRMTDAIFDLLSAADPVLRRESFSLIVREPRDSGWLGRGLFGFLTEQLTAARARGEIPAEPSAEALTQIVMTAIFGFLVIESEPADVRRASAHRMLDLLLAVPAGAGAAGEGEAR